MKNLVRAYSGLTWALDGNKMDSHREVAWTTAQVLPVMLW